MVVLIDTNVIMDALQERSPFDIAAKEILMLGQRNKFKCLFTANAATDIFYLYSKARDVKSANIALGFLLKVYSVVSVAQEDCLAALSLPILDFEDALVVACKSTVTPSAVPASRQPLFANSQYGAPIIFGATPIK